MITLTLTMNDPAAIARAVHLVALPAAAAAAAVN
jgi:hypothetical protein